MTHSLKSMMAAYTLKSNAWIITFVLTFLLVSETVSSSQCTDGNYTHDELTCCLCGAGQHLVDHCTKNLQYGKCNLCADDRFTSEPNDQTSCNRCTSCSHPHENLEEEEPCTAARDRKCRCRKDHYCVSVIAETCRLCQPCVKCGAEGVKVPCAGNDDTVCNEIEGGIPSWAIVIIILLIIALTVGVAVFIWKNTRYCNRQQEPSSLMNGHAPDVEMQPLADVDIQPHLPEIAEVIGWKHMQNIARRSGMTEPIIQSCQLDHPHDSQEQTVQLLGKWVEIKGKKASRDLIQILETGNKRDMAEKVARILSSAA